MKTVTSIVIALLMIMVILISCCDKQPTFTQEEVEKAVLELENQALGFWSAGNPAKFGDNFSDDASYFDDINAHIRLDGIEEIKEHFNSLEGAIPPHEYELVDARVQSFSTTAVLTLHYGARQEDVETIPTWKATSVYNYSNDKWQVVHAHWSLIKSE
jgi:hypothetical protein